MMKIFLCLCAFLCFALDEASAAAEELQLLKVLAPANDPSKNKSTFQFGKSSGTSYELAVTLLGTGEGRVVSHNLGGLICGGDCTEIYSSGTVVTLSASPAFGSEFVGWGGGICSGVSDCSITVDAAKNVTATFSLVSGQSLAAGWNTFANATGGSQTLQWRAVATDPGGNVYAAGYASSSVNSQPFSGVLDAVIAKYSPDGQIVWTKMLGTAVFDVASGLAVSQDAIYVVGQTTGNLAGQSNHGQEDGFVVKMSSSTGEPEWIRLIGGGGDDSLESISISSDGIYVVGSASSSVGGQPFSGIRDALVAKLDAMGNTIWVRLVGGAAADWAVASVASAAGGVFVAGSAEAGFDGQAGVGGSDIFIAKFDPDGVRQWLNLSGSPADDVVVGIDVDDVGSIYVSGYTSGSLGGQSNSGSADVFLQRRSPTGELLWTRLVGGTGFDSGGKVRFDTGSGLAWLAGSGACAGGWNWSCISGTNGFVAGFGRDGVRKYLHTLGGLGGTGATGLSVTNGAVVVAGISNASWGHPIESFAADSFYSGFLSRLQPWAHLSIVRAGAGSGLVFSSPGGLDCGSTCNAVFPVGSLISLYASPSSGSAFSGWSGDCGSPALCSYRVAFGETLTASFVPNVAVTIARFDLTDDGKGDIVWRNGTTGENYLYPMDGRTILGTEGYIRSVPAPWMVAAVGDFDGDGKADLLWRNTSTGENYLYFMDGKTILATEGFIRSVPANWVVAGVGDFDGDGKADILWRNTTTGENYLYFMDGKLIKATEGYTRSVPTTWSAAAVGDFDGDGKADILWRNPTTGENYLYFMDGKLIKATEGYLRSVPSPWVVAGSGDFDGDGKADLLWRNTSTGENYLYFLDGKVIKATEGFIRSVATNWSAASVTDFDGDGKADILWRNTTTGENYMYPMDGRTIKATEGFIRSVPPGWSVVTK